MIFDFRKALYSGFAIFDAEWTAKIAFLFMMQFVIADGCPRGYVFIENTSLVIDLVLSTLVFGAATIVFRILAAFWAHSCRKN